jgi:microcin C transport system substrate-binding protein
MKSKLASSVYRLSLAVSFTACASVGLTSSLNAMADNTSPNESVEIAPSAYKQHGIAMHGDLKYSKEFTHFAYANPEAPKGGKIKLAATGTFDSLNPFIVKGHSAAGMSYLGQGFLYDSLTVQSNDEPFSQYGSVAKEIEWPEDRSWVRFHLEPNAKFQDGEAIRSDDIKFSFETLTSKGHPLYSSYYGNVTKVETPDELTVTFYFDSNTNKELALIVGQLPILPKHYWQDKDFSKTTLTPPVGSGPYRIVAVDPGRSITYERVKDWWGKDKAINKGKFNFDTVEYDYYRDNTVAIEALKAGEFDLRIENSSKEWATSYNGKHFKSGQMVKQEIAHNNPTGMQAFAFNSRRKPFDDPKVRQALGYMFDFEWTNANLFYGAYQRTTSYFQNSELASSGLPTGKELEILKALEANPEYKSLIPETLFTEAFTVPTTDGSGNFRTNMRQAIRLFKQAGWTLDKGKLKNPAGEPLTIELLLYSPTFERVALPFKENLGRLGIELDVRLIDTQQYVKRYQSFDFDMVIATFGQSDSPGNEQRDFWHSSQAENQGSRNILGIKNPVIDELIRQVIAAPDRDTLVATTRALDRMLLSGHYVIPQWNFPAYRVVFWNKFGHPSGVETHYFTTDTWWFDSAKASQVKSPKAAK